MWRCPALFRWDFLNLRAIGLVVGKTVVEDNVEQGLVDVDAAVVVDEAHFAEAIHEEADARAGSADHLGECLLGDFWNDDMRVIGKPEFGHKEQDTRQALFTGVEELVDEVGLGSHAAGDEELHEHLGEVTLRVHDANHFIA